MKNSPDFIAFISATSLHLIIGGVLLMNVDFDLPKDKPKEAVTIIEASVISQKVFDDLAQLKADKLKEELRLREEARRQKEREEAEKARQLALLKKQAEERIKAEKAEILRKKLEAERVAAEKALAAKVLREKKEAAEALKKKQAAEKKALEEKQALEKIKAEKLAKEKAAKEKAAKEKAAKEKLAKEKAAKEKARLKAIEDARIKAEQEAKRKAEEAAAEAERLRQEELDRQMEAEFSDDFSSARNAKQLSEIAKYEALIRGKISRNWAVDPTMKGSSCTLAIKLAPDGLVISAQMSSGDRRLCDSARRAALKARTLPIPKDPEIAPQFRDFDITLEPDV